MNCKGKVIQLEEATKAANGKNIQNILIADRTATARVTLWEEDINKLVTNKSYQFKQLVLKEFRGERQLSSIKDHTKIAQIDHDLDEIARNEVQLPVNTIKEAQIVGVFSIEHFSVCLKCNGKYLEKKSLVLVTDVACSNVWIFVIEM